MEERGMNQSTEIKEVGERTQQERQVQKVGGTDSRKFGNSSPPGGRCWWVAINTMWVG
jgi:hypothetical protein